MRASVRSEREELAAAAMAQGIILPTYVPATGPLPAEAEANNAEESTSETATATAASATAHDNTREALLVAAAAEEERARRLMLAAAGGGGANAASQLLNAYHGLGHPQLSLNPFLTGGGPSAAASAAAQFQAAASLSAAGGGPQLSHRALLLARAAQQPSSTAHAWLQLQSNRSLALGGRLGPSGLTAAGLGSGFGGAGINPLLYGGVTQHSSVNDSLQLHQLVSSLGNKRERGEGDMSDEYAKIAELRRRFL